MQAWLMGSYDNRSSCNLASGMSSKSVILLSGEAAGPLRESTIALSQCFPQPANKVEVQSSQPLTGLNLHPSTGQQEEGYDRRVIDFFDRALRVSK
jgi:hypothetical protein